MLNFKNLSKISRIIGVLAILTLSSALLANNASGDSFFDIIKGNVKNGDGEPLIGASVTIKGTSKGTVTDGNGDFSIEANPTDILIISYIGFNSVEISANAISDVVTLEEASNLINEVSVVGSRFSKPRTDTDRPVPIDVINLREIQSTGQIDLGQSIHYSAPSFNAVKFGINDAAPFVDPATLRGLGPDQVLVTVNNKRRHKVSFLSINDGVGKGQPGTDINVVPSMSLKRVEVLRDGAAAQYGSDAIAGVINLELNDANSGGAVTAYYGQGHTKPNLDVKNVIPPVLTKDGATFNLAANLGLKLGAKGFVNTTLTYSDTEGYDRSGRYSNSNGFYVKDKVKDDSLIRVNNINLDRAVLGSAENRTIGGFLNSGLSLNDNWNAYLFTGYTNKHVVTGVFTRPPSNSRRSVLELFPNGYNPVAPADLVDFSITAGLKGKLGKGWMSDFSLSQGSNKVDWYAENTVNPSLGAASPTEFYIGQTKIGQSLFNADLTKNFNEGTFPNYSLAVGTEVRYETFGQKAGDKASYETGPLFKTKDVGSSGREGFSNKTAGNWNRTNLGLYIEGETEINKSVLFGAAIRGENYSDFGANLSYKLNTRLKATQNIAVRGSVSRGFRAPSMTQIHYSNFSNISFDNAGNSIINPVISANSDLAKILGINGLKQETSFDLAGGLMLKLGDLSFTTDLYQIDVDNRIMLSGGISTKAIPEFVAAGFPQQTTVFVNAIDTKTKGFESVLSYNKVLNNLNRIGVNLAYSSMNKTLVGNRKTDKGIEVVDATAAKYITDGLPKNKFIGSINYDIKSVGVLFRASQFGEVSDPLAGLAVKPTDPSLPTYQVFGSKTLLDLALNVRLVQKITLSIGVNNLTDVYPELLQVPQLSNEVIYSRRVNQFGTQGRFWFTSATYKF